MNRFYVYGHYKPNESIPFYIGKGCGKRSHNKEGHNLWWDRIVNKYGYEIKMLCEDITEQEAFWLEKKLIAIFGRSNLGKGPLVNMTDGGEGTRLFGEKN